MDTPNTPGTNTPASQPENDQPNQANQANAERFNRPGAVDLSSFQAEGQSAGGGRGGYVIDVTEAEFNTEVVNRSMTVPVVVYLWSARAEGIDQFTSVLERLVNEKAGRLLLAKVDTEANQQIAMSLQVQAIPTVVAVLRGQPVPLFQGAPSEDEVRGVFDQILQAAVANGVTGKAEPVGGAEAEAEEPPSDPRIDAAFEAINAGDFDKAAEAYQQILNESPNDAEAKAGLHQVELLRRTSDTDAAAALAAAAENPDDVDAQLVAADVDVAAGRAEDAFARLIDVVRRTTDESRDRVRARLLELFEVVGASDPRVVKARGQLASALF